MRTKTKSTKEKRKLNASQPSGVQTFWIRRANPELDQSGDWLLKHLKEIRKESKVRADIIWHRGFGTASTTKSASRKIGDWFFSSRYLSVCRWWISLWSTMEQSEFEKPVGSPGVLGIIWNLPSWHWNSGNICSITDGITSGRTYHSGSRLLDRGACHPKEFEIDDNWFGF